MASNNGTPAPFSKVQQELLAQMTPAGRNVAKECAKFNAGIAKGLIMGYYVVGQTVGEALKEENQAKYGANIAKQLVAFVPMLNNDTGLLYNLRNFAITYTPTYVQAQSTCQMNNGSYLSLAHWLALIRIENAKDRDKMMATIIRESMSANDVTAMIRSGEVDRKNVRGGGRKPSQPASVMSGLQKMGSSALAICNLLTAYDKPVMGAIVKLGEEQITDNLLNKLVEDRDMFAKLSTSALEAKDKLDTAIESVQARLLEKKSAEEQAAADAAAAGGEAGKPKAKPRGKKGKNKKKRTVAARRPEPATV